MIQRKEGNGHGPPYNVAFVLQRLRVCLAGGCSDLGCHHSCPMVYLFCDIAGPCVDRYSSECTVSALLRRYTSIGSTD